MLVFGILVILFLFSIRNFNKNHAYMFPIYFCFIYIYTYIGTFFFDFALIVPFEAQLSVDVMNGDSLFLVGLSFIYTIFFFIFGIVCSGKAKPLHPLNLKKGFSLDNKILYFLIPIFIYLSFIPFDFNQIFHRTTYLTNIRNHYLVILFKFVSPFSAFLCAFINNKLVRYLSFLLILSVPFSLNTRLLSVDIILFYIGCELSTRKSPFLEKVFLVTLLMLSVISSLGLRHNATQGIIPNLMELVNFSFSKDEILYSINYVTSFSVYAIQYSIENNLSDKKSFLISINPIPSSFLDIDYLIMNSRFNVFSPVPGMAMVYNRGVICHGIFYFLSGYIFSNLLKRYRNDYVYSVFVTLFFMFVFLNAQYILRESVRMLYYSISLSFFISFFNIYRKRMDNV